MSGERRRPTRHNVTGLVFFAKRLPTTIQFASTKPPLHRRKEREHRGQARWLQVAQDNHLLFAIDHEDDENLVIQLKNMVEVYAGNPVQLTHTGGELRRRESS